MDADKPYQPAGTTSLSNLELRCPPLPQTLMEALELLDNPDQMDVSTVTEVVKRDPVVVARLLQNVNSAYYGLRRSISSAERAVVMLGPVAVTGIVVGMNMMKLRNVVEGPTSACFTRLIRHSIAAAHLTRHLLSIMRPHAAPGAELASDGFTAGLLHDFGKIILVYNFPEQAVALYESKELDDQIRNESMRETEQLLFGCDHVEAGEFAARKLSFPEVLTNVIRFHHDVAGLEPQLPTARLARATAAANLAAKALGYPFREPREWEDLEDDTIWSLLAEHDLPEGQPLSYFLDELQSMKKDVTEYVEHLSFTP